jgi:TolA-binding protein
LQQEIEETHVKTLETFVKTIQTKLVRRVAVLEQDMAKQAEAMDQLRESSARTEDNLSRLITGVDRLAQELPRRLAQRREAESDGAEPEFEPEVLPPPRPKSNSGSSANARKIAKIAWVSLLGAALLGLVGWGAMKIASKAFTHSQDAATSQGTTPGAKPVKPPAAADNKTKIAAAQEAADRKDYQMAEEIYRQIVKDQPNNAEALKGLASVLYRQDKIDDAAAVLDKIPKE